MKLLVTLPALLSCLLAICHAADTPEYLPFFDPARGFKPAQRSLTEIFLQIAGSLEATGSPESYLRHMQAEHLRIATKFREKTGRELEGRWPAYMSDSYVEQMIENWKLLSPKLHLDALAKEAGKYAREGIRGTDGEGTILIGIFNHHQDQVVAAMEGKVAGAGFADLKVKLARELEFTPAAERLAALVEQEKALSEADRKEYARLLKHEHFTKAEFTQLDHFYKNGYDKLTSEGKSEMSRRVWAGTREAKPDIARLDAVSAAQAFRTRETVLFKKIEGVLTPGKAAELEEAINSVFIDLGRTAEAEFELALIAQAVQ